MSQLAVGVDLGGTKIAFALVNEDGTVTATHQLPTDAAEGPAAVIDRIAAGIEVVRGDHPVLGVGIGCPGLVDPVRGVAQHAVNLGWRDVPLGDELRQRLKPDMPIIMQNDVRAGALGEQVFGAARGCDDFLYLTIGTGLGGAAVANGRLINGHTFFATDLGHISMDPEGRLCACGQRGCYETVVSGVGLLAGLREYAPAYPDSVLARAAESPSAILAAAGQGDALALRLLEEAANHLGTLIAYAAAVLNPALVVIGGGLGHAAAGWLLDGAALELRRRTLPYVHESLRLVLGQVTASAVGAAALVWYDQSGS